MAIIFNKSLSTSNFLNAYNNNIVEFESDNVLDSVKCEITIGSLTFEITPINNVFYFNFKEILSVLINPNNFIDTLTPNLSLADVTSHIYDFTSETYLEQEVTYEITFTDSGTESIAETYKFLKSVEQLEQNKKGVVTSGNNFYALSPFQKETANTYNVTYFEGYPFDLSFLMNTAGSTTILNESNGLSYSFPFDYNVSRLFFSDGRITITIDDYLPLVDGMNELKITRGADIIYVNVNKIPSMQGEYLKWLNSYGGWSYWLFNCIHKRENKTTDLGDINNDFLNLNETIDSFKNIGKTSQETLTLHTTNTNELDQQVINEIFDSPKVYYFTGLRFSQVTDVSWLACNVNSRSQVITDYKKKTKNYKLSVELPQKYTMLL